MDDPAQNPAEPKKPRTFAQFLETSPPDVAEEVCDRIVSGSPIGSPGTYLRTPDLQLHCTKCDGIRTFKCAENSLYLTDTLNYEHLTYTCRNCREVTKKFSVAVKGNGHTGPVQKLGELPPFGPPTPPRVFKLIGEEYRELFLKGRRAENHGLGIGAYAYYRRIIEHQRAR
jgi:hypothetical protein